MNSVKRIVLTGGPCAGKTTCLSRISDRLEALGYRVFVATEAATMLLSSGVKISDLDNNFTFDFQDKLINLQLSLEQTFDSLAHSLDQPSVILCDRGVMDSKAFMEPMTWQALLDHNDWTEVGLRDKHYDAVIHLVTTGIGAEEYYTLGNNIARSGTAAQAAELDYKLRDAWTGHPHLRVVDNSTGFEEKVKRVISNVCTVVGVPEPLEIERKFLVKSMNDLPVFSKTFDIEQTYLRDATGKKGRVRRRGVEGSIKSGGSFVYTHTIKERISDTKRIEHERRISSREYLKLLETADPKRKAITKTRTCFLWKNKYFELDGFIDPNKDLQLLEIELDSDDEKFELPPFIEIDKEVTGDKSYTNSYLAKK